MASKVLNLVLMCDTCPVILQGSNICFLIAQWLEHPIGILEGHGHGFDSGWETQKIYFLNNSS